MTVIIRMKNLPISAGSSDVRSFFSGLKIPDGAVHILGGEEGEVFVGFASDEDARLAMARQGQMIHGSEIRLLLSSKSEQSSVIEQHKSGLYSSPNQPADDYVPTAPSAQPQTWAGNPYAARSGYEASYPPQNSNARPEFSNRRDSFGDHGRAMQMEAPVPKREEPSVEEYGYKATFDEPSSNRFGGSAAPPMRPQDPLPKAAPIVQTGLPPAPIRQQAPPQQISPKGNYGYRGNSGPPAGSQGGDSWRDTSYGQPPNNSFHPQRNGPPSDVRKPPINNQPFPDSHRIRENVPPPQQLPQGGAHFNGPPFGGPPSGSGLRPFPNGPQHGPPQGPPLGPPHHHHPNRGPPPPNKFPNRNGPLPFHNGPPSQMNRPNQNHPPSYRPPPSVPILPPKPVLAAPKATPPISQALAGEKYYIELTRLPNDLLSNSALDKFIQPSVPLTISSLKTVYGPGGIHINTIIRLDSIQDYAKMIKRDGEMGIKIRQSDKATFESADDAPPVPIITPKVQEEEDAPKRRSRWGGKSPQRESSEKERSPPRRKSRSPAFRKRRRSRSPHRREDHADPTRWSVQVTNVPFRMREEELIDWFSEKARPAKLLRTFYSDGNASDRWVAEFSSESLMKRAFSIKTLCQGRTLKLSYIDNEKADEILKIEDMYGKEKRIKNEEARPFQMIQEQVEAANPPSFFNQPSLAPRGPPSSNQNPSFSNQSMPPHHSNQNGFNNGHPPSQNGQGVPPPIRGGYPPRGGGPGFPPRGGMSGGPSPPMRGPGSGNGSMPFYQGGGPSAFGPSGAQGPPGDMYRGGFRGGRGRGGPPPRGGYHQGGYRDDLPPARNEFMEVVQSIGPRGTVLGCTGFPSDVTLSDVCDFFHGYDPDRNSIRIRRTEDGIVTGECLLAVYDTNTARRAVEDLDGQHFRNSIVKVQIL